VAADDGNIKIMGIDNINRKLKNRLMCKSCTVCFEHVVSAATLGIILVNGHKPFNDRHIAGKYVEFEIILTVYILVLILNMTSVGSLDS
jgi:hypothetical protein